MKINWDNAPKWAYWAAQDADGEWWWYEGKPYIGEKDELWLYDYAPSYDADLMCQTEPNPNWRDTLTEKPDNSKLPDGVLWSDINDAQDWLERGMDADMIIYNLLEDIQSLKEEIKNG